MKIDVPALIPTLPYRVLIEYDEDYKLWVATCIDTGAVATGETPEQAEFLIKETLACDIRAAMADGSIRNLRHRKAPDGIVEKWHHLLNNDPDAAVAVPLNISDEDAPKKGAQSEVKIIRHNERLAQ